MLRLRGFGHSPREPPVQHSQSNLSSLAALLQDAEARRTAIPPPAPDVDDSDSGVIDIAAMQKRAKEDRASMESATKTPVPVVATVRTASTDPDFVASLAGARRKKQLVLGAVLGVVGIAVIAIGFRSSHHPSASAARAPVVEQPTQVAPPSPAPPPAPAPPPPVVAAPAPDPVPAAAATDAVASNGASKAKTKKHKGAHSKAKGPKLTKVTSGGT